MSWDNTCTKSCTWGAKGTWAMAVLCHESHFALDLSSPLPCDLPSYSPMPQPWGELRADSNLQQPSHCCDNIQAFHYMFVVQKHLAPHRPWLGWRLWEGTFGESIQSQLALALTQQHLLPSILWLSLPTVPLITLLLRECSPVLCVGTYILPRPNPDGAERMKFLSQ